MSLKRTINHYSQFHGKDPNCILEGRVWVPGALCLMGTAKKVSYIIEDARSSKQKDPYRSIYIHDHEPGVKLYRRCKAGETRDISYKAFPRDLMILGFFGGIEYTSARDGSTKYLLKNQRMHLATTPNKKTLVVVHAIEGVKWVLKGGTMRVEDWIYD